MAKASKKQKIADTIYHVTWKGLVRVQNADKKEELPYEETIQYNAALVKAGPGHVWAAIMGKELLREKFPGFIAIATWFVKESWREDGEPIDLLPLMSRDRMIEYISDEELDIIPELFPDMGTLRQAIKLCEEDADGFAKYQEKRKAIKGPSLHIRKEIAKVQAQMKALAAGKSSGAVGKSSGVKPPIEIPADDDDEDSLELPDTDPEDLAGDAETLLAQKTPPPNKGGRPAKKIVDPLDGI